MNRRFLTLGLPVLGAILIAGIGYSAWVFNNEMTATATASGTVEVTGVVSGFTLKVKNATNDAVIVDTSKGTTTTGLNLELDQGGYSNADDPKKGITWQYGSTGAWTDLSTIDLEVSYANYNELTNLFDNHTLSLTYTITLKFGKGDAAAANTAYVVMNGDTGTVDGIITYTDTSITSHTNGVLATYEDIDVGLKYVSKPQSQSEHDKMKTALGMTSDSGKPGTNTVTLEITAAAIWTTVSN